MRNTLLILLFIALITPNIVIAASAFEFDPGNRIGGATELTTTNPRDTAINVIRWILGILGLIAVSVVLYGGFTWMTAAGNEEKVGQAKKILTYSIIGLVIILLSFILVSTIFKTASNVSGLYYQ